MKPKSPEIRNSKFGKIRFFTEFEKWHSGFEYEEQNLAACSNIRQNSPTFNFRFGYRIGSNRAVSNDGLKHFHFRYNQHPNQHPPPSRKSLCPPSTS